MAAMIPMAMFGLEVPPGDFPISGNDQVQSAFRITMAAIDPSAESEGEEGAVPRATLKILRTSAFDEDEYDSDGFDADEFEREMLNGGEGDSEEDSEEEEDDEVAGPSDPAKSKKARKAAAVKAIQKLLEKEDMEIDSEEDDDDLPNGVNGIKKSAKALGKMPADGDSDSDDGEILDDLDFEEFVICTLDPSKNYQQPLDITIGEDERVFFKVSGTHTIYLTGNYVVPAVDDSEGYDTDEDDEEYDLEPDSDELDEYDEEDELDDLVDPRVTEIDEDEAPALVKITEKKADKKGRNKRPAEEEIDGLDELIAETKAQEVTNGEAKLSKKQLKKLKKADGTSAVTLTEANKADSKAEPDAPSSANKKVQFAKNLEQGPTPIKDGTKVADKAKQGQATLGVKKVQGVTMDDKKIGSGPAAKNGDKVGMRYIGKLAKDNKVFDANKKGKPFTFKLGAGEVIKGWDIGIQGMSAGGERRITIPANLAYGSKGAPPDIPGNADLIFDVKLLEIGNKSK